MAKSTVTLNYKDLEKLKTTIGNVAKQEQVDQFIRDCCKDLAARLLAKVIKRTPVHDYTLDEEVHFTTKDGKEVNFHSDVGHYKKGGTLRRGWTSKTHDEAASGQGSGENATKYANTLQITKTGHYYLIEVKNPVEYAPYVEFGHRGRGGKGWVEGQFMLKLSSDEIQNSAPAILRAKLEKYMKGLVK